MDEHTKTPAPDWERLAWDWQKRAFDAEAKLAEAEKTLKKISAGDWGWKGGGSNIRNRGWCGSLAAKVLGEPADLAPGWPTGDVGTGKQP